VYNTFWKTYYTHIIRIIQLTFVHCIKQNILYTYYTYYTTHISKIHKTQFNTYVILKIPQDKSSRCCITFAYIYSKCSTLIILINNCTMSFGKFFVIDVFESFIMQRKSSVVACIQIKVQWLLFMKMCCRHLDKFFFMVPMIVFVMLVFLRF
jgi:hypothetical protein